MTYDEAVAVAVRRMGEAGTGPDGEPCDCEVCKEIRQARAALGADEPAQA